MPQDPFAQVQALLFETRVHPLALLSELTTLVPESLLQRAICVARSASDAELRTFLVRALTERLPTVAERIEATKGMPFPAGPRPLKVSVPEAKEAKRLIAQLTPQQRYEIFDRLLSAAEQIPIPSSRERMTPGGETRSGTRGRKKSKHKTSSKPKAPPAPSDRTPATSGPPEPLIESTGGVAAIDGPDFQGRDLGGAGSVGPDEGFESAGGDDGLESVPSAVPPPATSAVVEEPTERRDIVNLGFAHNEAADKILQQDEPLHPGESYYFWLNIGVAHKDAIGAPTPIDLKKLPEEAVLTVALFGFENELAITPGQDVGELKIQKDGSVKVLRQPAGRNPVPLSPAAPADYLEDFLLFPISVPQTKGECRLRINIYCSQVLVQSHVVSAYVTSSPASLADLYSKKLDYVLSQTLRASHLASITKEPHLLSLMVNDNGDGTHSFRFFGADGTERFKDDAQVDGPQLSGFLQQARRAMHKVSWDNEDEWNGAAYRYERQTFDRDKLARDLAYLARAGYRIYGGFISHLSTSAAELEALMANTGLVQIALKMSPRAVLPAAVVYDYQWKPEQFDFKTTKFELCPTFSDAIDKARAGGPPLEECDCFKGGCALKAMIADIRKPGSTKTLLDLPPIICPSGFWGYRHLLGLPLTLDGANKDVPPVIEFDDTVQMIACVSTDELFKIRDPHLAKLKTLKSELKFDRDEGYGAIFSRLRTTIPHVLYFYCHGGIKADSNLPYLEVGKKDQIMPVDWMGEGISWKGPNPLVFINGCHTTSLNPEVTLDFVSSFVQQSGAAGVIGTEITIFEPLAAKFAEECFSRFLGAPPHNERLPIGKAVRGARLELLKQGNPLGLVYIPYAVASLRLQDVDDN